MRAERDFIQRTTLRRTMKPTINRAITRMGTKIERRVPSQLAAVSLGGVR